MRPIVLVAALAAVSCGKATPAPELIERMDNPAQQIDPTLPEPMYQDFRDAGAEAPDAGCCTVAFALAATDESAAELLFGGQRFDMARTSGQWRVEACVELATQYYSFERGYPTDDDAGMLWVPAVNDAVPTRTDTAVATVANVFEVPDAGVCSTFDGGRYAVVSIDGGSAPFDAGSPADGGSPVDAGPLPVETVIAGSCDTLNAAAVLLDATSVAIDDEFTATTALPFAMQYFGAGVTHFAASSNGYLQLLPSASASPTQSSEPAPIPSGAQPNGIVAALWNDLVSASNSKVRTQVFGSAGARHLTVEWKDWSFLLAAEPLVTFQVKLFEGSNAVEIHYCQLAANGSTATFEQGFGAAVGIESLDGLRGVQHSYRTVGLTTANALHFE